MKKTLASPTPLKTVRLCLTLRKGILVKASSLREDGFAAALVLAVLIPLDPVCAGAFAPAEGRNEIFGKKYRL